MKFYKRWPGDITIKTGHLTPAQFGCYDRLLDHYYSTEKAVPASGVYSVCRAVTKADQVACDQVLAEFFELTPEGWIQQRAAEEIADAQPRIKAAKENGKLGGRPAREKPNGLSDETQGEIKSAVSAKASHEPDSSLRSENPPLPPSGWAFDRWWAAWPETGNKVAQDQCRRRWIRMGLDGELDLLLDAVERAKASQAWKDGLIPAPLTWLKQKRWLAPVTTDEGKFWAESRSGVEAMGEKLGLGRWDQAAFERSDGEDWLQYRARVFRAAGLTPRKAA